MSKNKPIILYQLYVANEIQYSSLSLEKLIGVAQKLAKEVCEEHGAPNNEWFMIESMKMDSLLKDGVVDQIKLDWKVTIDIKATVQK